MLTKNVNMYCLLLSSNSLCTFTLRMILFVTNVNSVSFEILKYFHCTSRAAPLQLKILVCLKALEAYFIKWTTSRVPPMDLRNPLEGYFWRKSKKYG